MDGGRAGKFCVVAKKNETKRSQVRVTFENVGLMCNHAKVVIHSFMQHPSLGGRLFVALSHQLTPLHEIRPIAKGSSALSKCSALSVALEPIAY